MRQLTMVLLLLNAAVVAAGQRSFNVTAETEIQVETLHRDITLRSGSPGQLVLQAEGDKPDEHFHIQQDARRIAIRSRSTSSGRTAQALVLTVPAGAKLSMSTVSGDILVDGVDAQLTISNVNGKITVQKSSGDLTINQLSGPLVLRDMGGETNLAAASVNGGLVYSGAPAAKSRLELMVASGDLDLHLGDDSAVTLSATTISGDIKDETGLFKISANDFGVGLKAGGVMNGGTATLTLNTISGRITIHKP